MISGKVDDSQSFDRKVFALSFDHGKCPVSWREIFSMARHKLRELVRLNSQDFRLEFVGATKI